MSQVPGATVLLAEDDPEVRSYLEMALRCQGYSVETASDGEEAIDVLNENPHIAAVLLDIVMPRRDGLETLKHIRTVNSTLPVIMVSGAATPLNVVDAMKSGAQDFLSKPINHSDLRKVLRAVLEPCEPAAEVSASEPSSLVFGSTPQMREIQSLLSHIGQSEAPALILGETGSGKEVLARQLHAHSPRHKQPFLKVNCAALPSELVESELFGYERGAFTGAFQRKPGLFELADKGTIFLDEIGDMDVKLQAKLLQVLQDSEFQRLGGKDTIRVDVRVVAATHRDLEAAIEENTFRQDLYYRLNVITLRLPPLRDRKEDIPQIAGFLLRKHAGDQPLPVMTPVLKQALLAYEWPGNIRELENVMRKLLILGRPDIIIRDLHTKIKTVRPRAAEVARSSAPDNDTILKQVHKAKEEAETAAICAALESTHWNRRSAARLLKIDYKALLYKMKKLGINDRMASLSDTQAVIPADTH